jgi:hypothetical protein
VKLTEFLFLDDMSHVLSEILKNTNFALQVDKSTDTASKTQMLAFVRLKTKVK